jgi:hypothetical protein
MISSARQRRFKPGAYPDNVRSVPVVTQPVPATSNAEVLRAGSGVPDLERYVMTGGGRPGVHRPPSVTDRVRQPRCGDGAC